MSSESDPLLEVATDVVDGQAVDWDGRLAASPEDRRVLHNLRRIAELSALYHQAEDPGLERPWPPDSPAGRPAAAPLFTWGHLQVTEHIGSGGFGDVYRAFNPILRRNVALKLRRDREPELGSAGAFIEEARRLARVRHPNVLAVYGADVHDGRVGLWADLLQGRTLEEELAASLDESSGGEGEAEPRFSASRSIEVALSVAEALAAVHGAGLIHGDVKASNVMIEEKNKVVLMDFGAGPDLGGGPGATSPVGSPLSMAPELFEGGRATHAADLYSLGVLLYRMLAGRYPVTAETFEGLAERHRKRARALSGLERKGLSPSLMRFVEDLLAPDPEGRPSAAGAVERLRWIQGAPTRRRRRTAATIIALSLVLGTAAAMIGYVQARRSEGRAVVARQEAEAVADFMGDVLASPRPNESGRQVMVSEALERAADRIDARFADQPQVRARALGIVGRTFLGLKNQAAAEPLLRLALVLHEQYSGVDDPAVFEIRLVLAQCLVESGRLEEAEDLLDATMLRAEGLEPHDLVHVRGRLIRAEIATDRQQFSEAKRLIEEALELRSGESWIDNPNRRVAELSLATSFLDAGDFGAAESLLRPILEWNERVNGERHGNTLAARLALAQALDRQGRSVEAEPLMRRNLAVAESWLGADDQYTISAISYLSNNLADQGKIGEAAEFSQRASELAELNYGPAHEFTLTTMGNHANRLSELGRVDEAAAMMRETISRADEAFGPAHQIALINRYNLAELLHLEGRSAEALVIAREARETMAATLGEGHLYTLVTDVVIGACLTDVGRPNEGEEILRRTLGLEREIMGESHPFTLEAQVYLARTLRARGESEEARRLLADAVERRREVLGDEHPKTIEAQEQLASW